MLLIGIDEAGYGPRLGPLCHGFCAIRCAAAGGVDSPPDLWTLLHPAVSRHPASEGSLAIDDSKKVYSPAAGLVALARGVQAFLDCCVDGDGGALQPLYTRILPPADRALLELDAWGREDENRTAGVSHAAPRTAGVSPVPGADNRRDTGGMIAAGLRQALHKADVAVLAVGARAMSVREFNARLKESGNKAEASWSVIARQLEPLLALAGPGEHAHAVIDRQGGRKFYAARLGGLFGGAPAWTESETPLRSAYRIESGGRSARIEFLVEADGASLPVALASMTAKLAREICMERLNAFFQAYAPGLKATAGYYSDAGRFLRETESLRRKLGIEDCAFVRDK